MIPAVSVTSQNSNTGNSINCAPVRRKLQARMEFERPNIENAGVEADPRRSNY